MADVPGGGFEVGSAFVSVSPEAEDFQEQVAALVEGTDIVVQVPVIPDGEGFRARLEEQVGAGDTAVTVPVVPDTAGFKVLLEDQLAATQGQAGAAGEAAGTAFDDGFTASLQRLAAVAFPASVTGEAAAAGDEAGAAFTRGMAGAAERAGGYFADVVPEAAADGEAAGAAFGERFAAAAAARGGELTGLGAEAEDEAGAAGEAAGLTFSERFSAIASRAGAFAGLTSGAETEGEEAGGLAGARFLGKLKGVLTGGAGSIEALVGAVFVGAAAVMASSFQAAMERLHTQAGVGQAAIAGLSADVLSLAAKVGESPDSLAASLYHVESAFASNGITATKALHDVQIAAEGARVGGADLVDTTNALTALMKSGLVGAAGSASQAMGYLNAIVGSGDMTMQDFTESLSSGLVAQAPLYHQSIVQVGAALATLGDENIRGAKAATDLRMAWQAIQSPLTTAGAALQHLGLTSTTLADTMREHGLTGAIDQFVAHLKASHVPIGEWGQYVTEIFGKRAGAGIGVLTAQYENLNLKLGTVSRGVHDFGNAWANTEATTSQKLHQLEAGLEALMIRLGQGILPVLGDIFSAITKALPSIEKWATAFGKIAAPAVKAFFTGLAATFKLLLGPLKDITVSVVVAVAAMLGIAKVIEIVKALRLAFIALQVAMAANPWVDLAIAIAVLVGLIIKYHKQIWDVIQKTWHDITSFFDSVARTVFKPVEEALAAFSGWWASHGAEIKEVWDSVWGAISATFKADWDIITGVVSAAWQLVGPYLTAALDVLKAYWTITWDAISAYFKVTWDAIAAIVKIGVAYVETVIKIAWDLIVGIFDVFLDLITGHWSKAWHDAETTVTQIWNAIKGFLGSVWDAISSLAEQVWDHIKTFLSQAWNTIKDTAISAFGDLRSGIAHIWDGIVSDVEGFVSHIESVIGGLLSHIPGAGIIGKIGGALGLAGGGVIPGYAPGRDSIPVMLSPGEGVLTPEAVRGLGGPAFVHAANATFAAARGMSRGMAYGGVVTSFAGGGVAGWDSGGGFASTGLDALVQALIDALTGQGGGFGPRPGGPQNLTVEQNYYGTNWPSPEQQQAMITRLTAAVSNA